MILRLVIAFLSVLWTVPAWADGPSFVGNCASISWNQNPESDLVGYRIYDRVSLSNAYGSPIKDVGANIALLPCSGFSFNVGQHYLSITAYDSSGNESTHSPDIAFVIVARGTVNDLAVSEIGATSVSLRWTVIDDSTGQPAKMAFRYKSPAMDWSQATDVTTGTCTAPITPLAIGSVQICTIISLSSATPYQFQGVPYRGTLNADAIFLALSNITGATTGTEGLPDNLIQLASDNFNRADENPLGNSIWATAYTSLNNPKIVSNALRGLTTGGGYALASYTGITWPDDQWSQVTLSTFTSSNSAPNPACRIATSPTNTKYWVDVLSNTYVLKRTVAGSNTTLAASGVTPANADEVRIECTGSTPTKIALFVNGAYVMAYYDSSSPITSGKAGVGLFVATAEANTMLDNWKGGGFSNRIVLFNDSFTRNDNTNLGLSWQSGYFSSGGALTTGFQIVGNSARVGIVTQAIAMSTVTDMLPADQWGSMTVKTLTASAPSGDFAWINLRCTGPPEFTCYTGELAKYPGGVFTSKITRTVAGVQTVLVEENSTTWAANDRLLFTAQGSTLALYRNNVLVLTTTDASLAEGQAGLGAIVYLGNLSDLELDDFQAGGFRTVPDSTRTALVIDAFTRADNTDLGATYDAGYTGDQNCQIVSNAVRTSTANSACRESYNGIALPADQYAQITLKTIVNTGSYGSYVWAHVRLSAPATATGYEAGAIVGTEARKSWIKVLGGVGDMVNEYNTTWTAGDVLRVDAVGSILTLYRNGVPLIEAPDTSIMAGRAGFGILTALAVADAELDNFEAGIFTSTAVAGDPCGCDQH